MATLDGEEVKSFEEMNRRLSMGELQKEVEDINRRLKLQAQSAFKKVLFS